jgi:hypothetical protein
MSALTLIATEEQISGDVSIALPTGHQATACKANKPIDAAAVPDVNPSLDCNRGARRAGHQAQRAPPRAAVPISPMNSRRRIPAPKDPLIVAVQTQLLEDAGAGRLKYVLGRRSPDRVNLRPRRISE